MGVDFFKDLFRRRITGMSVEIDAPFLDHIVAVDEVVFFNVGLEFFVDVGGARAVMVELGGGGGSGLMA